jgi:Fe-S cluster biogenesis protein NfuA
MPSADADVRALVARIESLLADVESIEHAAARETSLAAVKALVDLYGEGLARILAHVAEHAEPSAPVLRALGRDELVGHLLLLHDLHPDAAEARIRDALDALRPSLLTRRGGAELLGVSDAVALVRVHGSCRSGRPAAQPLRAAIADAVRAAAPELEGIELEDGPETESHGDRDRHLAALVTLERAPATSRHIARGAPEVVEARHQR